MVTLDANSDIKKVSVLTSKVPGKQTVPRAEAWAVRQVLVRWRGQKPLKISACPLPTRAKIAFAEIPLKSNSVFFESDTHKIKQCRTNAFKL